MDLNQNTQIAGVSSQNKNMAKVSYDEIADKDILELMGAKNMSAEEKEALYKQMIETIQNRVVARVSDQIVDEEVEEVKKAVESGDESKFSEILKRKGVDIEKIYAEEAFMYKVQMVNLINQGKTDEPK